MKKKIGIGFFLTVIVLIFLSACDSVSYEDFTQKQTENDDMKTDIDVNVTEDGKVHQIINETEKRSAKNAKKAKTSIKKKYKDSYNEMMNYCSNSNAENTGDLLEQGLISYYHFYAHLKMWGPAISVVSFLAGILLYVFARGNKALQKFGLYKLVILLPTGLLGSVLLLGILNEAFLY